MKSFVMACLMGGLSIGVVFSASSCGDDDTTNGVSNSKKLTELSEEEAYDLCVGFCEDVNVPLQEGICTFGGVTAGVLMPNQCQPTIDKCMENAVSCADQCDVSDEEGTDDGEEDTDEGEECDATVGEASDCFNAYAAMIEDISSQLSCDTPVSELEDLVAPVCITPSECAALEAKCPDMVPEPECPED